MLATASIVNTTRIGQAVSLPDRTLKAPTRTALLEGVRQRNALLDALFYDVGVVSQAEAASISPWLAAEGAILIVPPSGGELISLCSSIDEFYSAGGGAVHTMAVAGVGSSALGSAAFARNVADATGQKVAAVVSGYGMADIATEALGGFFWFGALNSLRHRFEVLDQWTEPYKSVEASLPERSTGSPTQESRDTRTVLALLKDQRFTFDLLTGHSKGNLVLSEALYSLKHEDEQRLNALSDSIRIVTVSARVAMPQPFKNVVDVMGAWDWFGGINSRPDIKPDHVVSAAWHHTNTELPAHLPVTETLKKLL